MNVEDIYNRLKGLVQYKDLTEEELLELCKVKLKEKDRDLDVVSKFNNKYEKKRAKELLHRYLQDFTIENISEKNTLIEIIFSEVIQSRLQDKVNVFYDRDKAVPLELLKAIQDNSNHIIKLKDSLGIYKAKQKESGYDVIANLKKRAKKWREENQASRTLFLPIKCLECGDIKPKPILLKIRTDMWEAQKHPFFKDRILFNEHIVRLYLEKTLTKEDVSKIFECSTDYIDWLVEKIWKTNLKYQEIEKLESGETI